jgi:hypothetical protein
MEKNEKPKNATLWEQFQNTIENLRNRSNIDALNTYTWLLTVLA